LSIPLWDPNFNYRHTPAGTLVAYEVNGIMMTFERTASTSNSQGPPDTNTAWWTRAIDHSERDSPIEWTPGIYPVGTILKRTINGQVTYYITLQQTTANMVPGGNTGRDRNAFAVIEWP
jgi:hypothetical protein